jgi:hypothetical protein
LQPMAKHEAVRTGPEERLQRAAHIFAAAAIRAVLNGHVSVTDGGIDNDGGVTGRRAEGAAASPPNRRSINAGPHRKHRE